MIQPKNPNLQEITTPLQAKRGNRKFFDTKHKVSYISYASGYIRREIKALCTVPYNSHTYKRCDRFVLNKRTYKKLKCIFPNGYEHSYTSTGVIKETCPQKRMDEIDRISSNYKGYRGRFYTLANCTLIA